MALFSACLGVHALLSSAPSSALKSFDVLISSPRLAPLFRCSLSKFAAVSPSLCGCLRAYSGCVT